MMHESTATGSPSAIILIAVAIIVWCGSAEFQKRKMQRDIVAPLARGKAEVESALAASATQRAVLERRLTRLCNLLDLHRYDLTDTAGAELSIWENGDGVSEVSYGVEPIKEAERELYLQRDHDNRRINIIDAGVGAIAYAYELTDDVSFQPTDLRDQSKAHLLAITPNKKKMLWGRMKSPSPPPDPSPVR